MGDDSTTPCVVCAKPVHLVAMEDDGTGIRPSSSCGHCEAATCFAGGSIGTACFERHCLRSHADLVATFDWDKFDDYEKQRFDRAREIEAQGA